MKAWAARCAVVHFGLTWHSHLGNKTMELIIMVGISNDQCEPRY